jgi:hypothetical protein
LLARGLGVVLNESCANERGHHATADPDDYLIGPLLPSRGKTFAKLKGSIVSS